MNLYATLAQLKAALDNLTSTTYDTALVTSLRHAARLVDAASGRQFYPELDTRYVDGNGREDLWLPWPVLAITTCSISQDYAVTYTALVAETDYWVSDGVTWEATPYQMLFMNPNGSYDYWYNYRRAVKLVGVFGYHRDYAHAWEASGDSVQDAAGITAAATSITVSDADGADAQGVTPRFSVGSLLKIESEYIEVTGVNTTTNILTVVRAVNGTTGATHAKSTAISLWRPEALATQACLIQAGRWFKRGQQAYADAGASVELGQLIFAKQLDPDVEAILMTAGLRRLTVG